MPLGRMLKKAIASSSEEVILSHACIVLREGMCWTILDPENNNELVRGVTTDFLRTEIANNRLQMDKGWDHGVDGVENKKATS